MGNSKAQGKFQRADKGPVPTIQASGLPVVWASVYFSLQRLQFAILKKSKLKVNLSLNLRFLSSFMFFCLGCSFNFIWLNGCKKPQHPLPPRLNNFLNLGGRLRHWFPYSHGRGDFICFGSTNQYLFLCLPGRLGQQRAAGMIPVTPEVSETSAEVKRCALSSRHSEC